ncbi:hypothetical protein SALBM311S_09033 [Streptomyces alboniger]
MCVRGVGSEGGKGRARGSGGHRSASGEHRRRSESGAARKTATLKNSGPGARRVEVNLRAPAPALRVRRLDGARSQAGRTAPRIADSPAWKTDSSRMYAPGPGAWIIVPLPTKRPT